MIEAQTMGPISEEEIAAIRSHFTYDKETGVVTRIKGPSSRWLGPVSAVRTKYLYMRLNRRDYYAHRVAWLLCHGVWSSKFIDHINGIKTDNRIANLREADRAQNQWNASLRRDSSSGYKGVSRKQSGRWQASISVDGRQITLGTFSSPEQAHQAYCMAAAEHFGEYANNGSGPIQGDM